jgi:hypothetical protein
MEYGPYVTTTLCFPPEGPSSLSVSVQHNVRFGSHMCVYAIAVYLTLSIFALILIYTSLASHSSRMDGDSHPLQLL